MKAVAFILLLFLAPAFAAGTSAQPQTPAPENPFFLAAGVVSDAPKNTVTRGDRRTVLRVLKLNHDETIIAQLVAERATTREITALARQLIADLEKSTRSLRELAGQKNIPLPEARGEAGDLKAWNEKPLAALDADYLFRVQDALDDLAALYGKAVKKSKDPELVALAQKRLLVVQELQKRAEAINLSAL
jgi:predicted outer membrane protein